VFVSYVKRSGICIELNADELACIGHPFVYAAS
jgi:hypothetical protein